MDTSGFSQVGRYGTISLMKKNESNAIVTAFGIDTEELTFGRDPACSVRLYYPDVSLVHCKIVFQERKAFLVVLGINGLLVDSCKVYANSSASNTATPTTIPLSNNSEFEIHGKRFKFSYPPKELRTALMATPARPGHRALRLSMIHSAQVFSPRPSQDPRENLRILRSPLRNTFKSFAKDSPSPLKAAPFAASSRDAYASPAEHHQPLAEEDEEEDHIILVDGNHPRVVEEDKDLVILEDVEMPRPGSPISTSTPTQQSYQPQPRYMQSAQLQPQTPPRQRSLSRNTLHRAVLIRSAQRAVLKAESEEREREEEEEEEMEVLGAVAADSESDDDVIMHHDVNGRDAVEGENNDEIDDGDDENDEYDDEEEYDDEGEEEDGRGRGRTVNKEAQKSVWRKSLERIWPFRGSSPSKEDINEEEKEDYAATGSRGDPMRADHEDSDEDAEDENQDAPAPLPALTTSRAIMQTPVRRNLGSFMTPQVHAKSLHSNTAFPQAQDIDAQPQPGRYSLGGGEARRVIRTEQIWRVKDIIVPSTTANRTSDAGSIPNSYSSAQNGRANGSPAYRQAIGDEERKAIQERRRSALRQVDTFFAGGVPGMGPPSTPARTLQSSSSPIKSSMPSASTSSLSSAASPSKRSAAAKPDDKDREDDEQLDTKSLLERMKETVEGMKRRRSMAPATPVRGGNGPGLGPGGLATPARVGPTLSRAGFGRGVNSNVRLGMGGVPDVDENDGKKDVGRTDEEMFFSDREVDSDRSRDEREVFSLLRPGVLDEVTTRDEKSVNVPDIVLPDVEDITPSEEPEEATPPAVPLPVATEDDNEINVDSKRGSRARFMRATRPSPSPAPPEDDDGDDNFEDEPMDQSTKSNAKGSKSRPSTRRVKTPQPQTPQEAVEAEENEPEPAPLTKSTTRRTRKPTVEPEPAEDRVETAAPAVIRRSRRAATAEPEESTVTAAPAARRGRKAIAKPEVDAAGGVGAKKGRRAATVDPEEEGDVITPLPATTKRSVKRVATPVSENEVAEETETQPPVRRGRTPRAAAKGKNSEQGSGAAKREKNVAALEAEVAHDDDDDPLDSIGQDEAESSAAVSKPKGRKKAAVVKEEEVAEKPPPASRVVKAKAPALKTPAVKARAGKKTPATAPAAVPQGVNKENTRGSEESSVVDPEESAKVKVKVSRTSKRATSGTTTRSGKVKEEMEMTEVVPEPEVSRPKVMRATRARTRT